MAFVVEIGSAVAGQVDEHGLILFFGRFEALVKRQSHFFLACACDFLSAIAYGRSRLRRKRHSGVLREVKALQRRLIAGFKDKKARDRRDSDEEPEKLN